MSTTYSIILTRQTLAFVRSKNVTPMDSIVAVFNTFDDVLEFFSTLKLNGVMDDGYKIVQYRPDTVSGPLKTFIC